MNEAAMKRSSQSHVDQINAIEGLEADISTDDEGAAMLSVRIADQEWTANSQSTLRTMVGAMDHINSEMTERQIVAVLKRAFPVKRQRSEASRKRSAQWFADQRGQQFARALR